MAGKPVVIRLLDPPVDEFLPNPKDKTKEEKVKTSYEKRISELSTRLDISSEEVEKRIEKAHTTNPMLAIRGIRLLLKNQSILKMQVRAMVRAYAKLKKSGVDAKLEIMVPNVMDPNEFVEARRIIEEEADKILNSEGIASGKDRQIQIGTMVELTWIGIMRRFWK
jgi:pyruvate,orthophosphate dikinase